MSNRLNCVACLTSIVLTTWCAGSAAQSEAPASAYTAMAPLERYLIASRDEEIALARSAGPASISGEAEVMVLGTHGYETVVKGTNGFVCFVQRSWAASFDDPDFWNPRLRGPNCFNSIAARTELPQYFQRTAWALAGATHQQMVERTKAAIAAHQLKDPEPGAFSFMLSKDGYLGDKAGGPWLPHVMLFIPHGQTALWGAGKPGSPILGEDTSPIESTVLFIPVRSWSDGSPAPQPAAKHVM